MTDQFLVQVPLYDVLIQKVFFLYMKFTLTWHPEPFVNLCFHFFFLLNLAIPVQGGSGEGG